MPRPTMQRPALACGCGCGTQCCVPSESRPTTDKRGGGRQTTRHARLMCGHTGLNSRGSVAESLACRKEGHAHKYLACLLRSVWMFAAVVTPGCATHVAAGRDRAARAHLRGYSFGVFGTFALKFELCSACSSAPQGRGEPHRCIANLKGTRTLPACCIRRSRRQPDLGVQRCGLLSNPSSQSAGHPRVAGDWRPAVTLASVAYVQYGCYNCVRTEGGSTMSDGKESKEDGEAPEVAPLQHTADESKSSGDGNAVVPSSRSARTSDGAANGSGGDSSGSSRNSSSDSKERGDASEDKTGGSGDGDGDDEAGVVQDDGEEPADVDNDGAQSTSHRDGRGAADTGPGASGASPPSHDTTSGSRPPSKRKAGVGRPVGSAHSSHGGRGRPPSGRSQPSASTRPPSGRSRSASAESMDSETASLRESLLAMTVARRQSEAELQLLVNRVNHLQAEEEKAGRRIAETWKRVDEIRKLKERDEERLRAQAKERADRQRYEEQMRKQHVAKAEVRRDHKAGSRLRAQRMKEEKAAEVKRQKQRDLEELEAIRKKERDDKAALRAKARKSEEDAANKRRADEERKRRAAQAAYDKRMREEEQAAERARQTVARMEAMEAELIAQLKRAQDEQIKAYHDLEENIA